MRGESVNPYASPAVSGVDRGPARFRLRRWFAGTLFLGLGYDYFRLWFFGFHPFVTSLWIFFLTIVVSVVMRKYAKIVLDESGVRYKDLVQVVEISWGRVSGVVHRNAKTTIATDSPLVQVTVSREHESYDAIVDRIAELEVKHDFAVSDFRVVEGQ